MRKKYPGILRVLVVLAMVVALAGMAAIPAVAAEPTTCPEVELSAVSGTVGAPITVTVDGPDTWEGYPVTVEFDGAVLTTSPAAVTANEDGDASCQFSVPATIGGVPHAVTVKVAATQCMAAFTVQPALKILPITGPAGTPATVTGSGFGTMVPVTVMVTVGGEVFAAGVPVASDGSFTATGTIPAGLMAGPNDLYAIDGAANEATLVDGFKVTPLLVVSPGTGLAGSPVTITGEGWDPAGGDVDIQFGGQEWIGGIAGLDMDPVVAGIQGIMPEADGRLYATGVPTLTTTPSGGMAVQGVQGANIAATTFTVLPRELELTPESGPMGIRVTVTCINLTRGGNIAVDDLDIGTLDWNPAVIAITTGGVMTPTTLLVPSGLTVGANTVLAVDSGGLTAAKSFTVTRPTVTTDPDIGSEGTAVTVRGSGWVPNSVVTLQFGNTPAMTVFADANGNIALAMVVPDVPQAGVYYLSAEDGLGNTALDATFTVPGAVVTVDPPRGGIGSPLTISGSGFQGYSGISIQIGGYPFPATPLTSVVGDFTFSTTVPGLAPGPQVVTAEDGVGGSATTIFVILEAEETVDVALASIVDKLVIVWDYAGGDWLFFDPLDPGSDLTGLTAGTGYWINVDLPEGVDSIELVWGTHSYTLYDGWNNIGWLGL